MSESTTAATGTAATTATDTTASATTQTDGTCRAVYGDTNNPKGRIDVCVGGKWVTLLGTTGVNFLSGALSSPGQAVLNVPWNEIAIIPASEATIG